MVRPKKEYPTEAELQILQVFWDTGPSTVAKIVKALNRRQNGEATYASVLSLVTVMHSKGMVTRWKEGKKHVYQAKVGRGETLNKIFGNFVDIAFAGLPPKIAMHFLSKDDSISEEELASMHQILEGLEKDEQSRNT